MLRVTWAVFLQACLLEACSSPEEYAALHHMGLVMGVTPWVEHWRSMLSVGTEETVPPGKLGIPAAAADVGINSMMDEALPMDFSWQPPAAEGLLWQRDFAVPGSGCKPAAAAADALSTASEDKVLQEPVRSGLFWSL